MYTCLKVIRLELLIHCLNLQVCSCQIKHVLNFPATVRTYMQVYFHKFVKVSATCSIRNATYMNK